MEKNIHRESDHLAYIDRLCRICGLRAQKAAQRSSGQKPRKAAHHILTILNVFNIDTTKDTNIHSTSICNACYSKIRYYEHKPVAEWAVREAEKLKPTKFWCEYRDDIHFTECTLCLHYCSQEKGGRKRKLRKVPRTETPEGDVPVASVIESSTLRQAGSDPQIQIPCSTSSQDTAHHSSVEPLIASTANRIRRKLILETNPGPLTKIIPIESFLSSSTSMTDRATSPIKSFNISSTQTDISIPPDKGRIQVIESVSKSNTLLDTPLTTEEEKLATNLIKRMLAQSEDKGVVRLKTRGQPIILHRIRRPRKTLDKARSPSK